MLHVKQHRRLGCVRIHLGRRSYQRGSRGCSALSPAPFFWHSWGVLRGCGSCVFGARFLVAKRGLACPSLTRCSAPFWHQFCTRFSGLGGFDLRPDFRARFRYRVSGSLIRFPSAAQDQVPVCGPVFGSVSEPDCQRGFRICAGAGSVARLAIRARRGSEF